MVEILTVFLSEFLSLHQAGHGPDEQDLLDDLSDSEEDDAGSSSDDFAYDDEDGDGEAAQEVNPVLDLSERYFAECLALHPKISEALFKCGLLMQKLGSNQEALALMRKATKIKNDKSWKLRYNSLRLLVDKHKKLRSASSTPKPPPPMLRKARRKRKYDDILVDSDDEAAAAPRRKLQKRVRSPLLSPSQNTADRSRDADSRDDAPSGAGTPKASKCKAAKAKKEKQPAPSKKQEEAKRKRTIQSKLASYKKLKQLNQLKKARSVMKELVALDPESAAQARQEEGGRG